MKDPVTIAQIRERVAAIDVTDDSYAHAAEDHLYRDVLRTIAAGVADDPAALAAEALKSLDLRFERWYA